MKALAEKTFNVDKRRRLKVQRYHSSILGPSVPQRVWSSISPHHRAQTVLLMTIAVIAVGIFLTQAREILIPFTLAWLISLILSPIVLISRRRGLPNMLSATIVMVLAIAIVAALGFAVADPAKRWINELPSAMSKIQTRLTEVKGPLNDFKNLGDRISNLAAVEEADTAIAVKVKESSWLQGLLIDDIPIILTGTMIAIVLTYFLLLSQGQLLRQFTRLGETWAQKKRIIVTVRRIRTDLSIYLLTITIINICLGAIVALTLHLLGMSNSVFWGMLAGLLNFAPYVGPLAMAALLTLAGLSEFSQFGDGIVIPLTFLLITSIEGQLITPLIVGHRLSLSPIAVFLSVIFWTWMWGAAGALLAAPLLACITILCENLRMPHTVNKLATQW